MDSELSPSKEDKSINTDPVKTVIEEKVVTDVMGSTLMRSAVRKFLATEDPSLSPIASPVQAVVASVTSPSSSALPTLDAPTSGLPLTSVIPLGSTLSLAPPVSSSPAPPAFTFGSSTAVISCANITKTTDSSTTIVATTVSPPNFILSSPLQGSTSTTDSVKKSDSVKLISFDQGKLESSFHMPSSNSNVKKDQEHKTEGTQLQNVPEGTQLQNVPEKSASVSNSSVSVNVTSSEDKKPSFSFGLSTSATTTTNTASSFTFGVTSTDSGSSKLLSPSTFGLDNNKTNSINDQPKLPLFGTLSSTKPSETTKLDTEISNNVKPTNSFQFGSTSEAKKTEKPDNKQIGLFSFGASNSATSGSADNKAFTFDAPTSTPIDENKSTQLAKPIFQFGVSSLNAPQINSNEPTQQAKNKSGPGASVGSGLFGIKSPTLTKSSSVVTTSSNSCGIFGFSAIQPATTSSAAPLVGSVSSTTTTSSPGTFQFQQNKQEEKPPNDGGGFPFKFTTNTTSPQTTKPSFTFGAKSLPLPSFGSSIGQPSAPGFGSSTPQANASFGSSTGQTNVPAFGSSTGQASASTFSSSTPQTSAPAFGSLNRQGNAPVFGASSGSSVFGASSNQNNVPAFGATTAQTNAPAFGTSTVQSTTPAFGATTAQTNAPAFGTSTVQSSTLAFGGTTVQSSTPTFGALSAQATTTSFCASPAQPSASAFGASTAQNRTNAFGSTSITAAFGNVTPAAPLSFSTFSNTSAAPTFGTTAAPTFGATSTTGFGSSATTQPNPPVFAAMQPQQSQAPSFAFGAPAASNISGGAFNFGTTQNQVQAPSSGVFQFGSSSSTAQPFQFNAATPTSNPQGIFLFI